MDNISKTEKFTILQWNAQSLRPKLISLDAMLTCEKIHVAIISETWLDPECNLNVSQYKVFRKDRIDCYGGVAILTHKSLQVRQCPINLNNPGIEALHLKLLNCKNLEHVVSIYCPSSVRTTQTDWDNLFSLFANKSIIAGDFNAHHTNWSYKTDQRGSQLVDSLVDSNFISLNDGSYTRIKLVNNNIQKTSPDVTFVSSDIAMHFSWNVLNENLGSDHMLIKYSMNYIDDVNYSKRRNFKRADWEAYRKSLVEPFTNTPDYMLDVQDRYYYFIEQIEKSANKYIPYIKFCNNPQSKFKPKQYWTPSLSKVVAERRLALSKFRRNPTPQNYDILQNKISSANVLIRNARIQNWKKFCSELDETISVSEMWRRMRWYKGYRKISFHPSQEQREDLLCSLAPDSVSERKPTLVSTNHLLESDLTLQELECCLKRKDTAPGRDGITYSMLYHLPQVAKKYLLDTYNFVLKSSYVPKPWLNICVVPIPKPTREPNMIPKLRPISLISCVCKTFHNILSKRIEWYVEYHKVISIHATGFRKSQSCLDCLVRLITNIQIGLSDNIQTAACFLDIDNAYNNISVVKTVKILDDLNIGKTICEYFWHFLNNRSLNIKKEDSDHVMTRFTNQGLAQGDPISPLIFNIVTSKICHMINNIYIAQYADDFVFYTSNKNLHTCQINLQRALNVMTQLLGELGLQLSASKSTVVVFSRGRNRQLVKLQLGNNLLTSSTSVRYLGIWLDQSLIWNKHINEIVEKCSKFLNLFKVLAGRSWGLHQKHMRRLYISLIRSRLDFGSYLYENSAKSNLYKLDKVQNQALRIMGGFIRSTPIHVMECELCIPPLEIRRKYLGLKYCLKANSWANNITSTLLYKLNNLTCKSYWQKKKKPLLPLCYDLMKEYNINSSYPLEMFKLDVWVSYIDVGNVIIPNLESIVNAKRTYDPTFLRYESLQELNVKYNNWYKLYTDGSKSANNLGAAFYDSVRNVKRNYKITQDVSIMTLELIAISEALSYIEIESSLFSKVVIFTDSKSALQHLIKSSRGKRSLPIAYTILNKIYSIGSKNITLKLQWIPSHLGIKGNEEADKLAKLGSQDGTNFDILPFYTEILHNFRKYCYNGWKEYFDERSKEKGIWYKIIQSAPPRIPWFAEVNFNRNTVVTALRLRSGHVPSRKFGHLMKKYDSPNCETCGTVDDIQHCLMECERNRGVRKELFENFYLNVKHVGIFHTILSVPNSDVARAVYDMCKMSL